MPKYWWVYILAILAVIVVVGVAWYFVTKEHSGGSQPGPGPDPSQAPGSIDNVSVANTGGSWVLSWTPSTQGSKATGYKYGIGPPSSSPSLTNTGYYQSGTVTDTKVVVDTTKVPTDTPVRADVYATNEWGSSPVTQLTFIAASSVPNATVANLPGETGILFQVPNATPQQYTLAFLLEFAGAVSKSEDITVKIVRTDSGASITPQVVDLVTTGPKAYLSAIVRVCDITKTPVNCPAGTTFGHNVTLYITTKAVNGIGTGTGTYPVNTPGTAPNSVTNLTAKYTSS